jgi:hypothetical protein
MRDISQWFEARSSEQDAAGIRRHLGGLVEKIIATAARRQANDDVLRTIATVPDPDHPDEPVNSL